MKICENCGHRNWTLKQDGNKYVCEECGKELPSGTISPHGHWLGRSKSTNGNGQEVVNDGFIIGPESNDT